jgi:hypothetical protein
MSWYAVTLSLLFERILVQFKVFGAKFFHIYGGGFVENLYTPKKALK